MAQKLQQQLKELGSKLESPPTSKDALIKLLKQAAASLSELEQSPSKSVMGSLQSLLNAIAKPELLKHQDREIRLFVASCACDITRITAPEPPYDDDVLKDIFQLIVSTFSDLSDMSSPSFGRRVAILETLARYRSCVVMLDLECDDLINEMFNIFFTLARDEYPENVLNSMEAIMEVLLEESEDVPDNLLLILLAVLDRDKKDVTMAARRLAMNVIEKCAAKLEPSIKHFLVSSMSGDSRELQHEISYHGVLYNVYCCAPQVVSGVVPYLTGELLSDKLDVRLKAVGLVGDLVSLPGSNISEVFKPVFLEFLKRLSDRAVEVRMSVLEHAKICLLENPFRPEAHQIISALCERFLDYDENVRKQVVSVVSDVVCHAITSIPVETVKLLSERLRDTSLLVKRYTLERLAEIHRVSCMKLTSDLRRADEYGWIVGKILRCFYDRDFRSDAIEPVLSFSLYPTNFSVKNKVIYWVRVFLGFEKVEVKALEKILEQKQRLQQEMQKYLSFRQLSQESDRIEIQKKETLCFRIMSRCFTDPANAEEKFQMLDQLKDSNIWKIFIQLLDPNTSSLQATGLQDDLLKLVGEKHQLNEFLSTLSQKCSYMLFDKTHVREILLESGVQKSSGNTDLLLSCMTILVILARFCPSLLHGVEKDLVRLLEDDNEIIKEGTLHILAKAGGTIREQLGASSCPLDLILERICIEGSRRQAKYAVHALASITKDDGLMSLSVLYKRLVDMLEERSHLPSVLQSLGCIAQAAMSVFETRESEVEKFIKENILKLGQIAGNESSGCYILELQIAGNESSGCWDDRSEHCSLKIFGLKTLVKSYLPVKDAHLRSGIDNIIEILKNILLFGDISGDIVSCLVDKAHLKLAAAKAVLRLSKQWEQKIPVDVFYLTFRTSEDNFPEVKKLLLSKVHQYVRDRILDPKYACAFLLDISALESDLEENKSYLSDVIQMCQQSKGRQISLLTDQTCPPLYPEYILTYVVHSLAHHPSFPNIDECKDVKTYEPMYRQLYTFLSMLVHANADGKSDLSFSRDKESISLLNSVFQSIKHSEDAIDRAKSKNSYALCDLGMAIIKRLAPDPVDLQKSSVSVTLPPMHYKMHEMQEETNMLVDGEKTWLADEGVLAHFESLEIKTNAIVHPVISEDDIMKDSETEGSEMPLGKLMKRLKAKAAKTKKEAKNEAAKSGATEKEFDILKMVNQINQDSLCTTSKFPSSNGHGYAGKKRSAPDLLKEKLNDDSMDTPVPKRRRTSAQGHKSSVGVGSKGSKKQADANQENMVNDFMRSDEELQVGSEDENGKVKTTEPTESESLFSRIRKKLGTSKQKGKRPDRDHGEAFDSSPEAKKPKKLPISDSTPSISSSKSESMQKEKAKNVILEKCTTKDNGSPAEELIGRQIRVWWPIDKKYYPGLVKSFDSEKKKHVILYEDGDVEVLRLDREQWKLVVDRRRPKAKKSGSAKVVRGGSSGQKRKSNGGSKLVTKSEEKSDEKPLSQVKGRRTPRKGSKRSKIKAHSSKERSVSPDADNTEVTTMSLDDDSDQEKRLKESITKSLPDVEKKQEEDSEKELSYAAETKEKESDSEDTETDNIVASPADTHESDDEVDSSFDKKQPKATKKESDQETDEDVHKIASDVTAKIPSVSATSVDVELPDDEPLSLWKRRSGKKGVR